jgi:integrase
VYDLRRSFAVWMEDAGIPRSRRKHYLGHSAGDVTGLYERRELLAWLEEDAGRLRAYAGAVLETLDGGLKLMGVA